MLVVSSSIGSAYDCELEKLQLKFATNEIIPKSHSGHLKFPRQHGHQWRPSALRFPFVFRIKSLSLDLATTPSQWS